MRTTTTVASIALLFLGLASGTGRAEERRDSMQDLDALASQGAWVELTQHLGDIAPAERGDAWKKLAERGAIGALETVKPDSEPLAAFATADALGKQYPFLLESASFRKARADAGLKGLEECYRLAPGSEECGRSALAYVKQGSDPDLALRAGKLVRQHESPVRAVPYFSLAVQDRQSAACEDADVAAAVVAGLGEPAGHEEVAPAHALAEVCFEKIKPALVAAAGDGGNFFANACGLMKAQHALSGLQARQCTSK